MADEDDEVEVKKSPLIKIILIAVVALVVLVGAVAATLFFAGFFDQKASDPLAEVLAGEGAADRPAAGPGPAAAASGSSAPGPTSAGAAPQPAARPAPQPKARQAPERVRFEQSYMELERALLANVTNSRKVMQVRLAVMTHYDERVFNNIKKHEFAIRSAVLDVMRQATEADITKATFRVELAEKIRLTMNALLEKYEDFGGIEEIHFTEFVFQ